MGKGFRKKDLAIHPIFWKNGTNRVGKEKKSQLVRGQKLKREGGKRESLV